MPSVYHELLDATISHLENLHARGVQFVSTSPETMASLNGPARRTQSPPTTLATAQPLTTLEPSTSPTTAPRSIAHQTAAPESLVGPALTCVEKDAAMAALRERVLPCVLCPHLVKTRTQVVFGVGDIHSPLLFVGEAPGADEDLRGEPFVGKAGQLLTKIIQTMGLGRDRVFIANILKCRPDTPGQTAGNRKPTPAEMQTCLPYLLDQIRIIQPRAIVALGATAVEGLFGKCEGITRLRGTWMQFRGIPVMPTYHPAYLLRNQALSEKRRVWEDMLKVMERLSLPISDRQRGFFLKASG